MVPCSYQPCTFLVEQSDGFLCPEGCGQHFCTPHKTMHFCPAKNDRRDREVTEYLTEMWRQGRIGLSDTDRTFIEARRGSGYGPLYHIRRKGRWYYYRFRSISAWRASGGETHWTVWTDRVNKSGDEDLGFVHLELEDLTEIEPVDG